MSGLLLFRCTPNLRSVRDLPDSRHAGVQCFTVNSTLGQSVSYHVASINSDQSFEDLGVKKFSEVLNVGEERFLRRDFDEGSCDCSVHAHCIHKETEFDVPSTKLSELAGTGSALRATGELVKRQGQEHSVVNGVTCTEKFATECRASDVAL